MLIHETSWVMSALRATNCREEKTCDFCEHTHTHQKKQMNLAQFSYKKGTKPRECSSSYWAGGGGGARRATWADLSDELLTLIFAHIDDAKLTKLARADKRTCLLARSAVHKQLGLSDSQYVVFKAVLERRESILLMGAPGSGKSFLLNVLKERMRAPLVTASTGAAAEKIGAQTFHSTFGLGLGQDPIEKIMKRAAGSRSHVRDCKSVIVDEVSMLTARVIDLGEAVIKRTKGGLVQFLACGDPMQLRAVSADEDGPFYASRIVRDVLRPYILHENKRQGARSKFLAILNRARVGCAVEADVRWLRACALAEVPTATVPPRLFCTNAEAGLHNEGAMARLTGQCKEYGIVRTGSEQEHRTWSSTAMPFPPVLRLKVGARVLLTVNLRAQGLHNGSTGTVVSLADESAVVAFDCGVCTRIVRHKVEKAKDEAVLATRAQLPLLVAFAISIHRAQGATLDSVVIDLKRAFAAGQVYVALSRARRIDHIVLSGLTLRALNHIDADALQFYQKSTARAARRAPRARGGLS